MFECEYSDGGHVDITAGRTFDSASSGGRVTIAGGEGSNVHYSNGGNGGDIGIFGGRAKGQGDMDNGGDISVRGGAAYKGYGGSIRLESGYSIEKSSGSVRIKSSNSGYSGFSGSVSLYSGFSTVGDSGNGYFGTGNSSRGSGGDIRIQVGVGHGYNSSDGGHLTLKSGDTMSSDKELFPDSGGNGGDITIISGASHYASR